MTRRTDVTYKPRKQYECFAVCITVNEAKACKHGNTNMGRFSKLLLKLTSVKI